MNNNSIEGIALTPNDLSCLKSWVEPDYIIMKNLVNSLNSRQRRGAKVENRRTIGYGIDTMFIPSISADEFCNQIKSVNITFKNILSASRMPSISETKLLIYKK